MNHRNELKQIRQMEKATKQKNKAARRGRWFAQHKKMLLVLLVLLLIVAVVAAGFFTMTKTGAVMWMYGQYFSGWDNHAEIEDFYYSEIELAEDLVLVFSKVENRFSDELLFSTSIGRKSLLFWNFDQVGFDNWKCLHRELTPEQLYFSYDSVCRIGDYTVIMACQFNGEAIYDNANTVPITLNASTFDDTFEWYSFNFKGRSARLIPAERVVLFYVLEDIPEDYVFTCDEKTITGAEIEAMLAEAG